MSDFPFNLFEDSSYQAKMAVLLVDSGILVLSEDCCSVVVVMMMMVK